MSYNTSVKCGLPEMTNFHLHGLRKACADPFRVSGKWKVSEQLMWRNVISETLHGWEKYPVKWLLWNQSLLPSGTADQIQTRVAICGTGLRRSDPSQDVCAPISALRSRKFGSFAVISIAKATNFKEKCEASTSHIMKYVCMYI